jgi:hypothetical protein
MTNHYHQLTNQDRMDLIDCINELLHSAYWRDEAQKKRVEDLRKTLKHELTMDEEKP